MGRVFGRHSIHVEAGVVGGDAGPLAGAFRSLRLAGPLPETPPRGSPCGCLPSPPPR